MELEMCNDFFTENDINNLPTAPPGGIQLPPGGGTLEFQVNHHVFYDASGDPNSIDMDEEIIARLMDDLNEEFTAISVEFRLGCIYYHNSNTYNNSLINNLLAEAHGIYGIPGSFNVYYSNSGACGQAYIGERSFAYSGISITDICVQTESKTFVHEFGHRFGLLHTHEGNYSLSCTQGNELVDGSNCLTKGDRICDTPADPNLQGRMSGCSYTGTCTDSNGDTYNPLTNNYMSYGTRECSTSFTSDQYAIMSVLANGSNFSQFLISESNLGTKTYSSNNQISNQAVTYSNLTITSGANLTIDACEMTIENSLTINPGSQLTIDN
ncbi:M43 family zinc metalloprotease [Marinoscillum sp.]|uniref:M43 family zinc metalloprotease n=1 Tax=Marinoscillum sp. TaxID=2024838 RepID=UPI003BA8BB39